MTKNNMAAAKTMLDRHFGEQLWQGMTGRERKDTAKALEQSNKDFDEIVKQITADYKESELTRRNDILTVLSCIVEAYHTDKLNRLSTRCFNFMEQQRRPRESKKSKP